MPAEQNMPDDPALRGAATKAAASKETGRTATRGNAKRATKTIETTAHAPSWAEPKEQFAVTLWADGGRVSDRTKTFTSNTLKIARRSLAMERHRSPRLRRSLLSGSVRRRCLTAATAWLCCSLSALAVAQSGSGTRRNVAWAPAHAQTPSWCEVRLPSEPASETGLVRETVSPTRSYFATASYGSRATDTMQQAPLSGVGDGWESRADSGSRRLDSPLQIHGDAPDPLVALVSGIRGTATEGSESGQSPANELTNYAISTKASTIASPPANRMEPAIWAIGAIAAGGLGVAGVGAPWLATRLTPMRRGWRL